MCDKPIIESLLDIDFYKLSMGQMIFHRHPKVPVTLSFINRTARVPLAEIVSIGRLREELEHCRTLRFSSQELHYIMGTYEYEQPMFQLDYINFLKGLALPEFNLEIDGDQLKISFPGDWAEATYWETLAMSIVNELYYRALMQKYSPFERELVESDGKIALGRKIRELRRNPNITFSDFGTRRRFSRQWQDYVVSILAKECPDQFKGTSNVLLAQRYGLMPTGTNAHELPMVYSGIYFEEDTEKNPTYSQHRVLADWEEEYGMGLSIFLPDTFGSDWFFSNAVTPKQFRNWKGSRQDSGIPLKYAEKRIQEYQDAGIDPKEKLIVFADGLRVETMKEISERLHGRIRYTFGWGTDLTNDLGFKSISIVVKAVEAAGHPVAKLSDNISKATGPRVAVERMKQMVGYTNTFAEACKS
ncbi:MAG: nicotinate phosphoribosyltransferase [Candidatus Zambryskibacteria bacterium RIFCSPLOWO2_01_FULL_39_39]|uniref:Nicotinate phosphoribosyltransferase n=1 Tax=Candidatus Zambryskibacteria bacterium RIFCSPLOWO2_01_FULL_39_39 TaxID=1802758 RepID=A0A1G2TZG9_9BACT|nr:MAG: nicotinate phosphoribosyltransferase [Candidatus Zambryskibacteria bacterium RIFCSPHIGHO2_01_FULL_39_63]OHA95009.1 MAG: nicotinate phosphoribosyltransferase [Candidatus Zambryskibacteria bacterium RIFCSPHIGHO2_02_FULL_39_19]OHA99190.1 MAG: nicotinate phosphoribosyltransferase [Candidatus Zambryskibacteria bacterium RIFCSPHIGHO2_12_FULL_39_21]OHB01952.1 MAG: nicotinate phosphoribosyltransferase [Candidatus Zambryskibacteria bacterium RIFCSPLOWO2_01_FULL_39_39]